MVYLVLCNDLMMYKICVLNIEDVLADVIWILVKLAR